MIVLDASCHRYYLWFKNPFFEALLCIDRIASDHKEMKKNHPEEEERCTFTDLKGFDRLVHQAQRGTACSLLKGDQLKTIRSVQWVRET